MAGKGGGALRERGWPPQMQPRAYTWSFFFLSRTRRLHEGGGHTCRQFVEPDISTDLLVLKG